MFTHYLGNPLITALLGGVQQNINIAIVLAIPCEVVVSRMGDGDTLEGKMSEEVLEHDIPVDIIFVDIAVPSYKDKGVRVQGRPFLEAGTEIGEFRDKLLVFPTCW